jgi:hypothetical protein
MATLRRIATTLFGVKHYISVAEDGFVILSPNTMEAAWVTFTGDAATPHRILLTHPSVRPAEWDLCPGGPLRDATPLIASNTTTALWTRKLNAAGGYTIHPADAHAAAEPPSSAGRAADAPELTVACPEDSPTPYLCADHTTTFVTETLCDCRDCWTSDPTGVCQFCRAEADRASRPVEPCAVCGTPTEYGPYCSRSCKRADYE